MKTLFTLLNKNNIENDFTSICVNTSFISSLQDKDNNSEVVKLLVEMIESPVRVTLFLKPNW